MPLIVDRRSFGEPESRAISPSENALTRLASGVMGASAMAAVAERWASHLGILAGWLAGILGAVIGFVLGLCKPPSKKGVPYDSLLESILTRLIFGIIVGAIGALGAWFWSAGYVHFNRTTVIISAGVGFLVGSLLGDEIPDDWLRLWPS